jgi:ATP/ADP translocase
MIAVARFVALAVLFAALWPVLCVAFMLASVPYTFVMALRHAARFVGCRRLADNMSVLLYGTVTVKVPQTARIVKFKDINKEED